MKYFMLITPGQSKKWLHFGRCPDHIFDTKKWVQGRSVGNDCFIVEVNFLVKLQNHKRFVKFSPTQRQKARTMYNCTKMLVIYGSRLNVHEPVDVT